MNATSRPQQSLLMRSPSPTEQPVRLEGSSRPQSGQKLNEDVFRNILTYLGDAHDIGAFARKSKFHQAMSTPFLKRAMEAHPNTAKDALREWRSLELTNEERNSHAMPGVSESFLSTRILQLRQAIRENAWAIFDLEIRQTPDRDPDEIRRYIEVG